MSCWFLEPLLGYVINPKLLKAEPLRIRQGTAELPNLDPFNGALTGEKTVSRARERHGRGSMVFRQR